MLRGTALAASTACTVERPRRWSGRDVAAVPPREARAQTAAELEALSTSRPTLGERHS